MYGASCPILFHLLFLLDKADNLSSLQALLTALSDLDDLCQTIEGAYQSSLKHGKYERWDEKS